jgi:hypothetical protein
MRLVLPFLLAAILAGCSLFEDAMPRRHVEMPKDAKPGTVTGSIVWKPVAGETLEGAVQMASRACAEYGLEAQPGARNDKGATAEMRYSCQ